MDKTKELLEKLGDMAKADLAGACDDDSADWASAGINGCNESLEQHNELLGYVIWLEHSLKAGLLPEGCTEEWLTYYRPDWLRSD